ncbi:MAG: HAD hydrolase-like protein, partial [Methyloligellaceae bacterium]
MTLRFIIFDCDGTLVDSQHLITTAMERAFETVNL